MIFNTKTTDTASTNPFLGKDYTLKDSRTQYLKYPNKLRILTESQRKTRDSIYHDDSPENYEETNCLCNEIGQDILISEVDRHGLPYHKVICTNCGLLRVSPRWKAQHYKTFYENHYRELYNPITGSKEETIARMATQESRKKIAAWVVESVARFGVRSSSIKIVEIGAGGGWNLANLSSQWERVGYDVDEEFLAIGRKLFNISLKLGWLEEALVDVSDADIILFSHVVEHFLKPHQALSKITRVAKPSALVLIEVPGIFRIHRTNLDPMSYMQNAHVYTFCSVTLKDVCEGSGLKVLSIDETVRSVCKKANVSEEKKQVPSLISHPQLYQHILRYLKMCEWGTRISLKLAQILGQNSLILRLWKKSYFPLLQFLVPKLSSQSSSSKVVPQSILND
ncbi:MAG: class I SAM-dependent methyltransferase [Cyanobacteria bacterium P01_E01_bin.42]